MVLQLLLSENAVAFSTYGWQRKFWIYHSYVSPR